MLGGGGGAGVRFCAMVTISWEFLGTGTYTTRMYMYIGYHREGTSQP